ncbi:hypothetical protein SAMN05216436_101268 [bacterium A37T11]|nr:hypothetical protein SAMN05216436_101268 [bacterium A37T11]
MKKWNTSILSISVVILFITSFFVWFACRKPTENLTVSLNINNGEPSKYHVILKVSDAKTAAAPAGATLNVTGQDASLIKSGTDSKSFRVYDGFAELALDPAHIPTSATPVKFNVSLSADGYLPVTQEVWIREDQFEQQVDINLINLSNPPDGIGVSVTKLNLNNGVLPALSKISLAAQAPQNGQATLAYHRASSQSLHKGLNAYTNAVALSENTGLDDENVSGDNTTFTDKDGLTTIVLPKGLDFYYYKEVGKKTKIGTRQVPIYSPEQTIKTSNANSSATIPPRILGYYQEEYSYIDPVYEKEKVNASSVELICTYYTNFADVEYRVFPQNTESGIDYSKNISILSGGAYPENELFFKSVGVTQISNYYFLFHDTDAAGNKHDIAVSPSSDVKWFISYALDQSTVNPITGKKIKAGDSVEYAINTDHHVTQRAAIEAYEVGGKVQLRTNVQCSWVGFYYPAPYKANYSYAVNSTRPRELATLPDPENLKVYASLKDLSSNYDLYGWTAFYGQNGFITGTILSKKPIQISFNSSVSYFGRNLTLRNVSGNTGAVSIFEESYSLPPTVNFKVSIKCTEKNLTLYPNASGPVYNLTGDYRQGYCRLESGTWSTQGLVIGDSYSAIGNYEGVPGEYQLTIDGTDIVDEASGNCSEIKKGIGDWTSTH